MTVTLDKFMKNFTPEERARVEARATELIEEELTLRALRRPKHLPDAERFCQHLNGAHGGTAMK